MQGQQKVEKENQHIGHQLPYIYYLTKDWVELHCLLWHNYLNKTQLKQIFKQSYSKVPKRFYVDI